MQVIISSINVVGLSEFYRSVSVFRVASWVMALRLNVGSIVISYFTEYWRRLCPCQLYQWGCDSAVDVWYVVISWFVSRITQKSYQANCEEYLCVSWSWPGITWWGFVRELGLVSKQESSTCGPHNTFSLLTIVLLKVSEVRLYKYSFLSPDVDPLWHYKLIKISCKCTD